MVEKDSDYPDRQTVEAAFESGALRIPQVELQFIDYDMRFAQAMRDTYIALTRREVLRSSKVVPERSPSLKRPHLVAEVVLPPRKRLQRDSV